MSRAIQQTLLAAWLMMVACLLLAAERPKVGIFEFEVSENVAPGLGGFLYDALLARMVASEKYTVVDWEQIDRVLKYIAQSQPNVSETDAKRQAVDQLGIEQMYVGSLRKVGARYYVSVKVLNLDLTVADADGAWASGEEALEGVIDRLAARLLMSPEERAAAKRQTGSPESTPSGNGRLLVRARPADARVRILNIKPRYRPGIELAPGRYHVEVSKPGYVPQRQWIRVAAGEDKMLAIALEEGEAPASGRAHSAAEKREVEADYFSALAKRDLPFTLLVRYLLVRQPLRREESAFQRALAAWERGDVETAAGEFRRLAEKGIPQAQYTLGQMYHDGHGVSQNDAQASRWYRRAADQGIALAQAGLGGMYLDGRGVPQDDAESVRWYRRAAEQSEPLGQGNLGWMYATGRGVQQDDAEAVRWYRQAAEQGYANAQAALGWRYLTGRGVGQDDAESVRWYRKAAEQGDAGAQNNLGSAYAEGRGVGRDLGEAVRWFRRAAEQGVVEAQNNLGVMYQNGRGVGQDAAEAVLWYRRAAEQGYADAEANLGWMYDRGRGVGQDAAEAVRWYRRAAEQGSAKGQHNLGVSYANGQGVERDGREAVRWYRKAAAQGYADAQTNLGWMYHNGRGVGRDEAEAVRWYRRAAEQGNAVAQHNLGWMYEHGRGVGRRDLFEAVRWYRRAAAQGHANAQSAIDRLCNRSLFPSAACK